MVTTMLQRIRVLLAVTLLAPAAMLAMVQPAYAYLDPGTGSMIVQLLLGGFAGALVVLKLYWAKFKALTSGNRATASESIKDRE